MILAQDRNGSLRHARPVLELLLLESPKQMQKRGACLMLVQHIKRNNGFNDPVFCSFLVRG